MLRLAALLLLLANAGYFAWSQGHLRPLGWGPVEQREPERLQQQVAADQLQVIPPKGSAPADAPAPPPAPAKPDTPDKAPTAATGPTSCQQVAGLSTAQADALQAALAGMGLDGGRWTRDESVLPERWIVYIGKFPSADLLSRKKTELRALRVEFRDVNAPALQPGLALGTYSAEAAAQTALQELGRSGVRSAKVVKERDEQRSVTLRLPALTAAEREAVEGLGGPLAGKGLAACP